MRLIARYVKDVTEHFELVTVYDEKITRETISKENPSFKTLMREHPSCIWFERKIKDDFGIKIENAFDNRRLIHQERFPQNISPMRKDFTQKEIDFADYVPYKYEAIEGDGVFQVAVGPIHAGIIEPGHFHFSQAGEDMLHQEVRHFYKYRAIEKMLEGKTLFEAKKIVSRISGNESIAYQIALRDIIVEASKMALPNSLRVEHAILLELERLIHHFTDLGFIPNDAGFASALAYCSKLSEDTRRVMKKLTNHRFGFDSIGFEKLSFDTLYLKEFIENLEKEISFFEDWIMDIPSLWDRFDTTGILSKENALKYDAVGVVARASGVAVDRRENEFYKSYGFELCLEKCGDVGARFKLRVAEVKNSIAMIKNFLEDYKRNSLLLKETKSKDGEYFTYVESSLGEIFMSIEIKNNTIERFFVRDPSFVNWQVLHLMMPNNIIADFPLINKSCDLSYAGNDL